MSKPTIITFSGSAKHGKDTSAGFLKKIISSNNKTSIQINYADYLKFLASKYLNWDGQKDEKGRTLLQQLGTEKVRKINPNFWVDNVINLARIFEEDYAYILIADCRFVNEVERWKELNYEVISVHIQRLNFDNGLTEKQRNHSSETALDNYLFDIYLSAKSLFDLEQEVKNKLAPVVRGLNE